MMILYRKFCLGISVVVCFWVSTLFAGFETAGGQPPKNNQGIIDSLNEEWKELEKLSSEVSAEDLKYLNWTSFIDDDNATELNLDSAGKQLNDEALFVDVTEKGNISERSFILLPGGAKHKSPSISLHSRTKNKKSDGGPWGSSYTQPIWRAYGKHKSRVQTVTQIPIAAALKNYIHFITANNNNVEHQTIKTANKTWENRNKMDKLTNQVKVVNRLLNQQYMREKNKMGFPLFSAALSHIYNAIENRKYKKNHTRKLFYVTKNQTPPAQFGFSECNKPKFWYHSRRNDNKRTSDELQNNHVKEKAKVSKSYVTLTTKSGNYPKQVHQYITKIPSANTYQHFPAKSEDVKLQTDVLDPTTGNLTPKAYALVNMHRVQHTPLGYIPRTINRQRSEHKNGNTLDTFSNMQNQGDAFASESFKQKKQVSEEKDFLDIRILQKLEEIQRLHNESEKKSNEIFDENHLDITGRSQGSASYRNHSTNMPICVYPDCESN